LFSRIFASVLSLLLVTGPTPLAAQTITRTVLPGMTLAPTVATIPSSPALAPSSINATILAPSVIIAAPAPLAAPAPAPAPTLSPAAPKAALAAIASPETSAKEKSNELDAMFENSRFMATEIVVGPKTFEPATKEDRQIVGYLKGMSGDDQRKKNILQAFTRTPDSAILAVLDSPVNPEYMAQAHSKAYSAYRAKLNNKLETIKAALPEILKKQFESTLSRYPHSSAESNELTTYSIPRGLEFWADFVSSEDFNTRVAASAFLNSRESAEDAANRIVKGMISPLRHESRVLNESTLTPPERTAVTRLAKAQMLNVGRWGRYMHVGGGNAFFILKDLFSAASQLTDPALLARFGRVIRFLAVTGIGVINDQGQGSEAYYTPMGDEMAYVMPSRGNLDTTAHELNHARFDRFVKRLTSWSKAKGYALPYEIDGPTNGYPGLGAFENLLDELNSWRIGESFSDKISDSKILQILHRSYGSQVGLENAQLFSETWTPAAVAGQSVPRLMLDRTRALNGVKDAELDSFGRDALKSGDVVKAHNVLRLIIARHPDLKTLPTERKALIEKFVRHSNEDVAAEARHILKKRAKQVDEDDDDISDKIDSIVSRKTSRSVKEKELLNVLGYALKADEKNHPGRQEYAVVLLQYVFKRWGWEPIRENGRTNRSPRPGHVFFAKAIDDLLARGMFDETSGQYRLDLVNLLVAYTYPQELPKLHRRLLQVISRPHANKNDLWLARMFLSPESEVSRTHVAWGDDTARAVQNDKRPVWSALEYAGEFYRTGLNYTLPGATWGRSPKVRLDTDTRAATEKALQRMTELQRDRYGRAVSHLSFMLAHKSQEVRSSARYAAAAYPGYIIGLEESILAGLTLPASAQRMELVSLVAMTDKGFLPKVEDFLDGSFTPTAEEAEMLALRR
jgi:hypothetical protein